MNKKQRIISMKKENIEEILTKYVNGTYTKEELEILIEAARGRKDDEAFEQNMDNIWEEAESVEETTLQIKKHEEEAKYLLKQISRFPKTFTLKPFLKYVAVILFMIIGAWTVYYVSEEIMTDEVAYITVSVNKGERQRVTLPDGTGVILNSNTRLKYPVDFEGKTRSVEIDGEGFFDVAKDPDKAFIIHTADADIRVLGTSFNVKAYNEDEAVAISVKTGRVQVDIENATLKLLPNEQLVLERTSREYSKHNEDIRKVMLWTDGKLYFNKASIQSVALELQRIYDCKIELDFEIMHDDYLYGVHDNQSLEAVLKSIKYSTGIDYRKEGKRIILYRK